MMESMVKGSRDGFGVFVMNKLRDVEMNAWMDEGLD